MPNPFFFCRFLKVSSKERLSSLIFAHLMHAVCVQGIFICSLVARSTSQRPIIRLLESSCLNVQLSLPYKPHSRCEIKRKLCRGHGIPPTAVASVERFHINHGTSAIRALICLVTLTFELLTQKLQCALLSVRSYQVWCLWDFSFSTYGPTPCQLDSPHDIATLTFDRGHGACR